MLGRQPDHADALQLLGVVALQQGNPARFIPTGLRHLGASDRFLGQVFAFG
jgi:hypothetical protein